MANDDDERIELEVGDKGGKIAISGSGTSRLIHALADFISPATQAFGAVGDFVRQFRLYREVTAAIVLEETAARLRDRGASPSSIPLKVLIPVLEKSSLEQADDAEMIARWSELLASSANESGSDQAIYIDILARMSSADAKLLDDIAMRPVANIGAFSQIADAPIHRRYDSSASMIRTFKGKKWERLCAQLVIRCETRGSAFAKLFIWDNETENEVFYYSRKARGDTDFESILDRVKTLGLLDVIEERIMVRDRYEISYTSVYLSYVGMEFFYSTHDPQYRQIPSERTNAPDMSDVGCLPANGETYNSSIVLEDLLKNERFRVGVNHPIPAEPNDY